MERNVKKESATSKMRNNIDVNTLKEIHENLMIKIIRKKN